MTPTALTPAAARRATKRAAEGAPRTSSARSAGHRTALKGTATPRRVSGPARGSAAATAARPASSPATAARPASSPARSAGTRTARPASPRRTAPARPRRVSGPSPSARTRARRPGAHRFAFGHPHSLGSAAADFLRTLPDHRLLDRAVRGRAWIPILGVLLAGIVAMQVETLKLSASTGRSLERVTALQSINQQLRDSVAVLSDDQRIERLAAGMNMVMPGPTQVRFLSPRGAVTRALNGIHVPDATVFLAALPGAQSTASTATANSPTQTPAAAGTGIVQGPSTAVTGATTGTPGTTSGVAATTGAGAVAATAPSPGSTPAAPAGTVTTGPSTTNTGVGSTSSGAATSTGSGASSATAGPSATTPNGAAGVPAGG